MQNIKENLKLDNMRPGEEPVLLIKRHWIILVKLFGYFFLGLIITITIYAFINNTFTHLIASCFWMIWSIFLYIEWIDHELDMYVITNNRIIGIDQVGFLNRKVSECNLGQVQEVGNQTKGLLANLLNYGTITIQTAGNATNFVMEFSPQPVENSRRILNEVDKYRDEEKSSKN